MAEELEKDRDAVRESLLSGKRADKGDAEMHGSATLVRKLDGFKYADFDPSTIC